MEELTQRQKGIVALRDLLFGYNIVFLGDEGWSQATTGTSWGKRVSR